MKKATKLTSLAAAAALTLIAGVGVGTAAGAAVAESPNSDRDHVASTSAVEYKKNASGQTYGSAAEAASPEAEPDLILVQATNGREGYALSSDLAGPMPSSPTEALAQQASARKQLSVPVYEADGKTVIGEFIIQVGKSAISEER